MGRRIDQRSDDLQKLNDRSWPAVRDDDGQRVGMLRFDVNEVDSEAIEVRAKLWQRIQRTLDTTPVVMSAPVVDERPCFCERHTLGPFRYCFLVRPAGVGKSSLEIVQRGLGHMDLERHYGFRRCGKHEFRDLVGACTGSFREKVCGPDRGAASCRYRTQKLAPRAEG